MSAARAFAGDTVETGGLAEGPADARGAGA